MILPSPFRENQWLLLSLSPQPSLCVKWSASMHVCVCLCNECPRCGTLWTPLIYMFWKYNQLSDKCSQLFHHLSNWVLPSSTIHLRCNAPNKNVFCLLYWLWNSLILSKTKSCIPPILVQKHEVTIFSFEILALTVVHCVSPPVLCFVLQCFWYYMSSERMNNCTTVCVSTVFFRYTLFWIKYR